MSEEKPEKTILEKSREYIASLKDIEFHARSTAERLAEIGLTIEDELKQKKIAERVGDLFSTQSQFISTLETLIEDYTIECNRLEQEQG